MTRRLPLYLVDAFAARPFEGNPAAVVPILDGAWPDDATLQAMAAEHNLSETAFLSRERDGGAWRLRWFTPAVEVDLCGHATLASAFVLGTELGEAGPFAFRTRSGLLRVERGEAGRLVLDFPAFPPRPVPAPPLEALAAALGARPREVWQARDWICVFATPEEVRALRPDHARIAALPDTAGAPEASAVAATAPGGGAARTIATAAGGGAEGYDCVSRYFAAKAGIPEDPVTGAAHTQLVPFWAARLGRDSLVCRQASRRGGTLWCELRGDRVRMAGTAVLYGRGEVFVDWRTRPAGADDSGNDG